MHVRCRAMMEYFAAPFPLRVSNLLGVQARHVNVEHYAPVVDNLRVLF
jgi:hypothetical protein